MNDRQYAAIIRRLDLLEQREPPLAAEFVTTATTPADDLLVIATGWDDGEHTFGPVRWSPVGGALPQAGDEAVILERDDGVWQVVAWWSGSQGTGVAQSALDALDTRIDALEAVRTVSGNIAADGTSSGTGFASSKTGTGLYTVTFSPAFASAPGVAALPVASGGVPWTCALTATPTTGGFSMRNVAAGSNADLAFSFIATGPA